MDHTRKLPDEVMLELLQYVPVLDLPRCAQVCRRWRRLASDESLWANLTLSDIKLPFKTLTKIMERGVRELKLDGSFIDPSSGSFSTNYKSPLRVLDLSTARMSMDCTRQILDRTSKLVELRLPCEDLDQKCFVGIGQNSNLEILDLSNACDPEAAWISHVLQNCKNLKELNMANTILNHRAVDALVSNLHSNLVRLNFSYISDYFSDKHVIKIVKKCPNLTHLDISHNNRLTPEVAKIVSKLEHLEELKNDQTDSDSEYTDEFEYDFEDDDSDDLDESDAINQWMMYKYSKDADDGMDILYLQNLNRIYNPSDYSGDD